MLLSRLNLGGGESNFPLYWIILVRRWQWEGSTRLHSVALKMGGKGDQSVVGWGVRRLGGGPGSYSTLPPVALSSYPKLVSVTPSLGGAPRWKRGRIGILPCFLL